MKKLAHLLIFITLASCAGAQLAPSETRTVDWVENTSASKADGYSTALTFFAQKFKDFDSVAKLKDPNSGTLVMKGNAPCNIFRQFGDVNDYSLQFTLTFQSKDKKSRFLFEDLMMISDRGNPISWGYNQITSAEQVEKAKACIEPIKKELIAKLSKKTEW